MPPVMHRVVTLDLAVDDWRWPFADMRRTAIDAHFARLRAAKPELWNGQVLLARDPHFEAGTFRARYFRTDFASFIAWRDWGFPDPAIFNVFGMGALRGADGGFVLGEMAGHTANAGRIYFASGTPDLSDIVGDAVDIAGSVAREVAEETGLTPTDYIVAPAWHCVASGALVAMIRILDIPHSASVVAARISAYLAAEDSPELSAVHIVRDIAGLTVAMPEFITAFLAAQIDGASMPEQGAPP